MIKNAIILFILLIIISIPYAIADGGIIIRDRDMWRVYNEEQQYCAINFKNGIQNMILTVDTSEKLTGEKAVWIFPVPAKPDTINIDIIKGFPYLQGYDVEKELNDYLTGTFWVMRASQVYILPGLIAFVMRSGVMSAGDFIGGVEVHKSIEKMGIKTELITTRDNQAFMEYLKDNDLNIPINFKEILDEYNGKDYSFVVSWIPDVDYFIRQQELLDDKDSRRIIGNSFGVQMSFPSEKIYYPLKPTSIYGSKIVPAAIYVMDWVEPEIYSEIQSQVEVNYFFQNNYNGPDTLKKFFNGFETSESDYLDHMSGQTIPGFKIKELKYTKIKINAPSNNLNEDLWITPSAPKKLRYAGYIEQNIVWIGLILFLIISCLASLTASLMIFRKNSPSLFKFTIFGLTNFLTFIGFFTLSKLLKIDIRFSKGLTLEKKPDSKKIFKRILFIGGILPTIGTIFWITMGIIDLIKYSGGLFDELSLILLMIPGILFLYLLCCLMVTPFVYAYYDKRKLTRFNLLFTIIFMLYTIPLEIVLKIFF